MRAVVGVCNQEQKRWEKSALGLHFGDSKLLDQLIWHISEWRKNIKLKRTKIYRLTVSISLSWVAV